MGPFKHRSVPGGGMSAASSFKRSIFLFFSLLIFLNCGGNAKRIDLENEEDSAVFTTAPVLKDFIVGPGDQLTIEVFGHHELDRKIQIEQSGEIYYPLLGYMNVDGLSVKELRALLTEKISRYYVDPDVNVSVAGVQSQKVFVLGEVHNPGVYPLQYPVTAFEVALRAGGFNDRAKESSIILVRETDEGTRVVKLNLEKVYRDGEANDNIYLQGGDILYVPRNIVTNLEGFIQHLSIFMRPFLDTERGVILWPTFTGVLQGESKGRAY